MVSIRVATDKIGSQSSDMQVLNTFADKLRSAGHEVTVEGRGPNKIQHVMLHKSCDVMIQVAGGKCLGTLVDFYKGIHNGYYHAKAGGFCYYKCYDANWKAVRAHDDHFSRSGDLAPYLGKTLPEIYSSMDGMYMGYGTTAEEIANTWLQAYSGQSTSNDSGGGGGGSILELFKQACSPWDKLGVEMDLVGDTMSIRRSNPDNALVLTENLILNNSVSIQDYDPETPNTYGTVKDQLLIDRFGEVPYTEQVEDPLNKPEHILQIAQRGHNHSIDLKCLLNKQLVAGKWVKLYLPSLAIYGRPYYITKSSYDSEMTTGVTLESAPPSIYVEVEQGDSSAEGESTDETSEEETTEEET